MTERNANQIRRLQLGLAGLLGLLLGSPASAQEVSMQEVTWAHPRPAGVERFMIFVSAVEGAEKDARQIDVGKPSGIPVGAGAVRYFTATVPAEFEEFIAVAAVAPNGSRSALSTWSRPAPSAPGQPVLIQP